MIDRSFLTSRDDLAQDYIESVVRRIKEAPDQILINSDGFRAFIVSNRRTESFVMFEALDGANFLEMSREDLRKYMKRKLAGAGIIGIEV